MNIQTQITLFLLALSCHLSYGQPTVLHGIGKSGVAGYYNEWTIHLFENDSIAMFCSLKEDSLDSRAMNRQFFGHLLPSEKYTYKVIIDRALYVDDCNKPVYDYMKTDTIPFFIDSTLFSEVKYWDIECKGTHKSETPVRITTTYYPFIAKDNNELVITLHPESSSGYIPVSIRTGKKCAVDIGVYRPEEDFYINKTQEGYELLQDHSLYVIPQNSICRNCLRKTKLEIRY